MPIAAQTWGSHDPRPADLVLFDWNGTVMDDLQRATDATNHAVAPFGLAPLTTEEFQRGFTLPLREWVTELGIPADHAPTVIERWNRAMEAPAPARASAHAALTALRGRGVTTGIVTAAGPESVRHDLRATGLDGLFDLVQTSVEDKAACLVALRPHAGRAIYVGDTAYDIASARAAGFTAVSIGGGYQHVSVLTAARPHRHVDDLAEVLSELEHPTAHHQVDLLATPGD